MADESHLLVLQQGINTWNAWRRENPGIQPDLVGANLKDGQFPYIDLSGARLLWANFSNANLRYANLRGAHISSAKMSGADLRGADLSTCRINKADLSDSILLWVDFRSTYLARSNLSGATLCETVFSDTDITEVMGLDSCIHIGPSIVDHRTIIKSGNLSKKFLVACGLPDHIAECIFAQKNVKSTYHTSFISYSSSDSAFVIKLYNDLLGVGVNTWLDIKQMTPGARILDTIIEAVSDQDKLILVCSSSSLKSDWVEDELMKAFSEERARKTDVVIPIRIDDSILLSDEPWAQKLKNSRYIGDFSNWINDSVYDKSFCDLLKALQRS